MKSAVLVIDVQSGLFDPEPRPYESDIVVGEINRITESARQRNVPVVFIQHEQPNSLLQHGSTGWQLQSKLTVATGDHVISKSTPDSFLKTNLQTLLTDLQVDNLIVCGYASEFCVDTTVRKAASLGYSITLVSDAHTTHDKEHATGAQIRSHHNATLPNIKSFGVTIQAVNAASLW